jgi:sulfur carrier protein ThiS
MPVQIIPIGMLKSLFGDRAVITVEAGCTVREFLLANAIKPELVAGVVVNGVMQSKDYLLQENDQVKLMAIMGGGSGLGRHD